MQPLETILCEATDPSLPIILMVSGGKDSTALLCALAEISADFLYKPEVVHFNHSLREEASLDEDFVRNLSAKYNFRFESFLLDVKGYAQKKSCSIEEAARILRYEKMRDYVSGKKPPGVIYTAHTADDQAETLLLRVLSGSGRTGLQGVRKEIFLDGGWSIKRPFISATSEQVLQYLKDIGQDYMFDKSNRDLKYRRNFVRWKLLPIMREINPSVTENLRDLADILSLEEDYLCSEVKKAHEKLKIIREKNYLRLEIEELIRYNLWLRRRLLRLLAPVDLDYRKNLILDKMISSPSTIGALEIGEGWSARIEYGGLIFEKKTAEDLDYCINVRSGDTVEIPGSGRTLILTFVDPARADFTDKSLEYFDADLINLESIHIRSRRDGDRINPFGMCGSKKVKDLFIDMKVPRRDRERAVIVESGGVILWLAPFRRSSDAPITDNTRKALKIKVIDNG